MNLIKRQYWIVFLTGLLIAAYVPIHLQSTYPLAGKDHKYFTTRLIDTQLHYQINGLSIQWYTPSFGGGLPSYAHPLSSQFSLPQLLTAFLDVWAALLLAYFIYAFIGYIFSYLVFYRILQFESTSAILGAALFSANGFYLEHLANGHLNFQGFPLLPIYLWILLDKNIRQTWAIAIIAITTATLVYSGSSYPAIIIAFSLLTCLPLMVLIKPHLFNAKQLLQRIGFGLTLAIGISISKLYATYSFMQFFPRDSVDKLSVPLHIAPVGLFLQLFGVMGLAPIFSITGEKMTTIRNLLQAYTGSYTGLWELDLSMQPTLWFLLTIGFILLLKKFFTSGLKLLTQPKIRWIALALFLLGLQISLEFTFARGLFFPTLRQLPFIRSTHVNPRFGASFIMPLAIIAALAFQVWIKNKKPQIKNILFVAFNSIGILSLAAYHLIPLPLLQERILDIRGLQEISAQIKNGETFPIESIGDVTDQRVFDTHSSNLFPYEILFGDNWRLFKPTIQLGSARQIINGYYNMNDPVAFVYPQLKQNKPFDRIPLSEQEQLEDFLAHRQPNWPISFGQQIANLITVLSLITFVILIFFSTFQPIIQKRH